MQGFPSRPLLFPREGGLGDEFGANRSNEFLELATQAKQY
jgi:hypothetical protein